MVKIPFAEKREKMIRQTLKDFDIRQIAESGQCFRLRPVSDLKQLQNQMQTIHIP